MAHSFSFNDTNMADYGITVVGGEWPFAKVGVTDTVNVPGMDGGQVKLSDFKGRPVLVNFWATW